MTGHERIKRQLTDLVADELNPLSAWLVRRHLSTCVECRAEWERIQTLWQDLRGFSEAIPPLQPLYPQKSDAKPGTTAEGDGFYRFLLERMPLRRIIVIPALALCAFAITALLPQTRPTVQHLLFLTFGSLSPKTVPLDTGKLNHGDSVETQLGVALSSLQESRYDTMRKQFLCNLASNAPDNPVVWAALFYDKPSETRRFGIPGIPGEAKEPWIPPASGPWMKNPNTDTLAAKAFLEDARKAERADPDNAFFTVMRSYALLSLQQAQPGIDAFVEASRKPYFRDYQAELIQSVWKANAIRNQDFSNLSRFVAPNAVIAYYMANLRAVGRAIYSRAMGLEVQGKRMEALKLRWALLNMGEKMQSPDASVAQYLVGTAIGSMSLARPGGKVYQQSWPPNLSPESSDYLAQSEAYYNQRLQEFRDWYNTPEATALAIRARSLQMKAPVLQQTFTSLDKRYLLGMPHLREYLAGSVVSLFLLCGGFWILFLGLIAALLAKTRRVQRVRTLHPAVGGAILTFFAIPLWFIGNHYIGELGVFLMIGAAVMVGVSVYQLLTLRHPGPWYGKYLLFGLSLLCLLLVWLVGRIFLTGLQFRLSETLCTINLIPQENLLGAVLLYTALPLPLPLLLLAGLAISSVRERVPVSAGVVLGLRRIAFPLTALLVLAFTLTTLIAAHYDRAFGDELDAMTREGVGYYERMSKTAKQ